MTTRAKLRGEPMTDAHLRLPTSLYRDITKAAAKSGKSTNNEMIQRLRWSLQAEQLRRVVREAVHSAFEMQSRTNGVREDK